MQVGTCRKEEVWMEGKILPWRRRREEEPAGEPEPEPLLNDKAEMTRQPTVEEVHQMLRLHYVQLHEAGELSDTTLHKLCWFADHYVPLLDGKWWDEEGGPDV